LPIADFNFGLRILAAAEAPYFLATESTEDTENFFFATDYADFSILAEGQPPIICFLSSVLRFFLVPWCLCGKSFFFDKQDGNWI
jgi:hypothetical protein